MALRYQDYIDELAAGRVAGVFVDDTGSPGLVSTPSHLHEQRKSWVGVLVPAHQMPEVLEQFPKALREVKKLTGAKELHFADIFGGRKQFKGVAPGVRIAFFEFMAWCFAHYRFPIFVQTLDPTSKALEDLGKHFPDGLRPFDFLNHEHLALFLLLLRVQHHLREDWGGAVARVFIDEGFQRNGIGLQIPGLRPEFADGLLCFANSASVLPLQLADFAAFGLNRTQLLLGNDALKDRDRKLLEIYSHVAWNYQNIEKRVLNLDAWGKYKPDQDKI